MLNDAEDKVAASDKEAIEAAIADVKKALESDDTAALTAAMDRLPAAQHKAAEVMYSQGPTPPADVGEAPGEDAVAAGCAGAGGDADGDVIDAEVVEENK